MKVFLTDVNGSTSRLGRDVGMLMESDTDSYLWNQILTATYEIRY
jgi:hypothetical protein